MLNCKALGTNKEDFINLANAVIRGYGDAKKMWDAFLEVAEKMDGKVLNKKFVDAIEEKIEGIGYASLGYKYSSDTEKRFSFSLRNRSYQRGECICGYFDSELSFDLEFMIFNEEKSRWDYSFTDENGRISYEKAKAGYEAIVNGYKRGDGTLHGSFSGKVQKWQDAIDNYDYYEMKMQNALARLGAEFEEINDFFVPNKIDSYDWFCALRDERKKK